MVMVSECSLGYMDPDPVSDKQMMEREKGRGRYILIYKSLYEVFGISLLNNLMLLRIMKVTQKYLNMVIYKVL